MESVAHQSVTERIARGEIPPPGWTKSSNNFPRFARAGPRTNAQADDLVPATSIENIVLPRERANSLPGRDSSKLYGGGSSRSSRRFGHGKRIQLSDLSARNGPTASASILVR
jgi:hypothetical protein